jgi:hypothetical protein
MKRVPFRSDGSADHVGALVDDDQDVIAASAAKPHGAQLRSMEIGTRNERCI